MIFHILAKKEIKEGKIIYPNFSLLPNNRPCIRDCCFLLNAFVEKIEVELSNLILKENEICLPFLNVSSVFLALNVIDGKNLK